MRIGFRQINSWLTFLLLRQRRGGGGGGLVAQSVERATPGEEVPVSQDISEPDESEPFRFILALAAGYFGTIPINPDPSGRIFRNHQDISEPTIRSSALMNF